MKTTFFSIFSLLFCLGSLFAQSPDVLKAKTILDKVAEKSKTYNSVKAEFSFVVENIQEKSKIANNGVMNMKGDKYKIELMDTETIFDGSALWTYMTEVNEVNISTPNLEEEDLISPAMIMSGYDQKYKYLANGEATVNGKKCDIVDLYPDKRDKSFSRIKLFVNQENMQIVRIMQIGKDGINITVEITKMTINPPITDDLFVFDAKKHPGVELVDMR